jgi:hypothetical protein
MKDRIMAPSYHSRVDKAHLAKVMAARRLLCVGEGFVVAAGQSDEAAPLTAVAGMIMAGFAEKEGPTK